MARPGSVLSSARLIALCTLSSRVTGLVRDMLLAQMYGLVGVLDAFNYGFQIPNLFRRLFGEGALSAAFVPIFTRTLENEGRESGVRLLARSLGLMVITITALVIALQLVILLIWWAAASDPEAGPRRLLLGLTATMLPFMLTICVVALFSSVLNCLHSFVPAALMPMVLNVGMIVGLLVLGPAMGDKPEQQIYGVAWSVIIAGVLQIVLLVPILRSRGMPIGWALDTKDPNVRRVLGLMAPVLIGQGVLILGPFLDIQVCWLFSKLKDGSPTANWFGWTFEYPLREGALSALTNAQRLYQFPLGVLAISLAVAALPTLSRLANSENWESWAGEFRRTLRMSLFAGLLAGALMLVWSEPIVRLLFEYRQFDAQDTLRVAAVMFWYGFGLWSFCAQHIVLRGFYSLSDIRTPLLISCALLPINLLLSLVLIWVPGIGESAFAMSAGITSTASVLVGMTYLQRRTHVALWDGRLLSAALRMVIACGCGALVLYLAGSTIESFGLGPVWVQRAVVTFGGLALGTAVSMVVGHVLGLPEPRAWFARGRHKDQD